MVPNGKGAEYVFTNFQFESVPDEVFEGQCKELSRELGLLKGLLERGSKARSH